MSVIFCFYKMYFSIFQSSLTWFFCYFIFVCWGYNGGIKTKFKIVKYILYLFISLFIINTTVLLFLY